MGLRESIEDILNPKRRMQDQLKQLKELALRIMGWNLKIFVL